MEDAFTGSLVLTLLGVVAFAYARLRQAWRAERSFARPHCADGDWARIDAAEAMAFSADVGHRAAGRSVERWLVRAARRAAAAPPGDGSDRSPAASGVPLENLFLSLQVRRRIPSVGI